MRVFLILIILIYSNKSNSQTGKFDTCDCSVLGESYSDSLGMYYSIPDLRTYSDLAIASGYTIYYCLKSTNELWTGKCFYTQFKPLHYELTFVRGRLTSGVVIDSTGNKLWEMVITKPLVGFIKKWDEKTQLYRSIEFDSSKLFFTDYNRDSSYMVNYTFYRKDFYYGKELRINDGNAYANGVLISSFQRNMEVERNSYRVKEYFSDGEIKAEGNIYGPITNMLNRYPFNYTKYKSKTWIYYDGIGGKNEIEHQTNVDWIEEGN